MNPVDQPMKVDFSRCSFFLICFGLIACRIFAADDAATDLAARLRAKEEGSSYVRVRMEFGDANNKQIMQLQIKSRASGNNADILYQILFPKERKGESVLLHRAGEKFNGTLFTPPGTIRQIALDHITESLFGSDLSYEDIIDSPFAWKQQAIVGNETLNGTVCQILESRPGKAHACSYSRVKTWVDPRRAVPLRIEKYDESGRAIRRIETMRVMLDGADSIPANLRIEGARGTVTEIDGSRIKRGVSYSDVEFSAAGLKELRVPPGSPQ